MRWWHAVAVVLAVVVIVALVMLLHPSRPAYAPSTTQRRHLR